MHGLTPESVSCHDAEESAVADGTPDIRSGGAVHASRKLLTGWRASCPCECVGDDARATGSAARDLGGSEPLFVAFTEAGAGGERLEEAFGEERKTGAGARGLGGGGDLASGGCAGDAGVGRGRQVAVGSYLGAWPWRVYQSLLGSPLPVSDPRMGTTILCWLAPDSLLATVRIDGPKSRSPFEPVGIALVPGDSSSSSSSPTSQ